MEWKDHSEANVEIITASMKESGDTVKDLSDGTAFSEGFVDKCLSGAILPGPKLQEIVLSRYDLTMIDGKVSHKP